MKIIIAQIIKYIVSHGIYWFIIRVNKVDEAQWPDGKLYLSGGVIIGLISSLGDGRSLFIRFLLSKYIGTWKAKAITPILTISNPDSKINGIAIVYRGYILPLLVWVINFSKVDMGFIL